MTLPTSSRLRSTFPWTTAVVSIVLISAIVILTLTGHVSGVAFAVLVTLLPSVMLGTGYAENTNRNVKNGLIVHKVQQGLENMGITPDVMKQNQEVVQTSLNTLATHTLALNTIVQHLIPQGGTDGPVHGG